MKIRIENRYHQVPRTMRSINAAGSQVFFVESGAKGKFYTMRDGFISTYHDARLGIANYRNRRYFVTEATAYVRDGADYTVYLPSENKFIRRPAFASDEASEEIDFVRSGLFAPEFSSEEACFGTIERLGMSRGLCGRMFYTRANGEILIRTENGFEPLLLQSSSIDETFVRLDVAVGQDGGDQHLVTLFFTLHDTMGARLWLEHFSAAQDIARRCSPFGTPLIRSDNVIFYSGEEDLARCVETLAQTVATINAGYTSELPSSNDGKLHSPVLATISSDFLNQLHFEFEAFGERFKHANHEKRVLLSPVYGPFCKLNDQIHACEGALGNRGKRREEAWWALHASFLPDSYRALPDKVYPEFKLDWAFGDLYMGYHTLGKDLSAAFFNNDMGLFERNEIRPQRVSSAEFFLYLGPDNNGLTEQLRQWWEQNNIDTYGFNWGDPANALGYIPVAALIREGRSEMDIKSMLTGATRLVAASLYDQ